MRHGFALLAFGLFLAGCEATVQATAPNVANPILLGPVDRVGGHRTGDVAPVGSFEAILEDRSGFLATPFTTVTITAVARDPKNVSYAVLESTRADPSLDAHVDSITAGASCTFAVLYASCSENATVAGRVTKHAPTGAAPPPGDGAPPPAAAGVTP